MQVIPNENSALARYFTGRVERVRDTLTACRLSRYADEVCVVLPRSGAEFERFVYWTEAMRDTFVRWSALPHVAAEHDVVTLASAHQALTRLATDARDLLTLYERRQARSARKEG
jgi:hypothetical protein